jgi:hypothetical protein
MPSWSGARFKKKDRDKFTLTFTFNIRMDLRETGWEGAKCMHVAQDRSQWRTLVNMEFIEFID